MSDSFFFCSCLVWALTLWVLIFIHVRNCCLLYLLAAGVEKKNPTCMFYDTFVGEEGNSTVEIWYQQKIEPVRMMKKSKMIVI